MGAGRAALDQSAGCFRCGLLRLTLPAIRAGSGFDQPAGGGLDDRLGAGRGAQLAPRIVDVEIDRFTIPIAFFIR